MSTKSQVTTSRSHRRMPSVARPLLFGIAGATLALALAGNVSADVGPFATTVSVRPSVSGHTIVHLAPLGTLRLDTHDAPVALELRVDELHLEEAERIAADPAVLATLEDEIAADARSALVAVALRCLLVAVVGGALGALAGRVRGRSAVVGAAIGATMVAGVGGASALTFRPGAVAEPRYSGLLAVAPTAVGDLQGVVERFGQYRAQLTDLVGNVVTLYRAAQGLPTLPSSSATIRVLHVSDIHLNPQAFDLIDLLVRQFDVDVVADTGDLTDWGTEPEGRLTERIGKLGEPSVWVRGNQDSVHTQRAVESQPNAVVLDGDPRSVGGLRFWGVGDRRYTPNKDQPVGKDVEREEAQAVAPAVAREVRRDGARAIDVVMVHDARMAGRLGGLVRLVLAGHTHEPRRTSARGTIVLIEGSTGGAGLRALRKEDPEPLTASLLHFDRSTRRLVAFDRITVDGLGESGARIERHVVNRPRAPEKVGPTTTVPTTTTSTTTSTTTTTTSPTSP